MVLDLNECDTSKFTRRHLDDFFTGICRLIDMNRHGEPMYWFDNSEKPHLHGASAVQFIKTSNITLHALDKLQAVFINIFSCKEFDADAARDYCIRYFSAKRYHCEILVRGADLYDE